MELDNADSLSKTTTVNNRNGFDLDEKESGEYDNFNNGIISTTTTNIEEENIETRTEVVGTILVDKPFFVPNNNNSGWSNTQVHKDQVRLQRSDTSTNHIINNTTTRSEGQYNSDNKIKAVSNMAKSDLYLNSRGSRPVPEEPTNKARQLQFVVSSSSKNGILVNNNDRIEDVTQTSRMIPNYKDQLYGRNDINYSGDVIRTNDNDKDHNSNPPGVAHRMDNGSSRGNSTNFPMSETNHQLIPDISSTYLVDTNQIEFNNDIDNMNNSTGSQSSNNSVTDPRKGRSNEIHTVEAVPVKSVVLVTAQLYNYNEDTDDNNINNNLNESVINRNGGVEVDHICNDNLTTAMKPIRRNGSRRIFYLLLAVIVTLLSIGVGIYVRNDGCRNDNCSTKTTNINSSETQIMEPSNVPTTSPTISHIPTIYRQPFQDGTELLNVVDKYLFNTNDIGEIITTYGPIEEWDVSNVADFSLLFSTMRTSKVIDFTADLSEWDMRSATNINLMFSGARKFNADLSRWDVSNVRLASNSFQGATNFQSDLSRWNVTSVEYTSSMFADTDNFKSDLSDWDVSNVLWMDRMFNNAVSFRSDLSRWNVSSVTDMSFMFSGAVNFESDLSKWDTSSVTTLNGFAEKTAKFNTDVSKWNTANVEVFNFMFHLAGTFQGIGIDLWDVRKGVFFDNTFTGARNFDANLSGWNTTNAITMIEMFAETNTFRGIGMEHWNLAKVTNTSKMFNGAIQFDCNVSNWDVSNIADMTEMFAQATKFQGIGLDSWQLDDKTETLNMFCEASALNKTNTADWNVTGSDLFC